MFQRVKECADELSKNLKSEGWKSGGFQVEEVGGVGREDDGGHGWGRPEAEAQCCRHLLQEARPGMNKHK